MLNWFYQLVEKTNNIVYLIIIIGLLSLGVYMLVKSADIFVSGASNLAKKLKVPSIVIGLTIVSFGTSAPETSVSIQAALASNADLSIGNVVGSNICNILLVLGIPAIFTPIIVNKENVRKDLLFMIGSMFLLLLFYLFFDVEGKWGLTLLEGVIFIILIIIYVIYNIIQARNNPQDYIADELEPVEKEKKGFVVVIFLILGLIGVLLGGDLVTYSASSIARVIGISDVLIGLTIVAFCTSLPELVTTLVAARKNENDIALGNVVGSNIFNVLFILGASAIITPQFFSTIVIYDIIIALGLSVFVFVLYLYKVQIKRKLGIVMISLYGLYLVFLVVREFM